VRRLVLASAGLVLVALGGAMAWRLSRPAAEVVVPLDERSPEQISEKEHEDWLRKLGYTD
jgi:hypothetical protein